MIFNIKNEGVLMKEYGHCWECERLIPVKYLIRIKTWDGHLGIGGAFHHNLLCKSCEKKADEVFEQV